MAFFNIEAARLYYEDIGQGQPIIFVHGVWMSSRFFKKQLPYFGQRYRAIAPDLRGHGRSSPVHSGHTVANYARDLHGLINGLGLDDVVLVGWSMGAFVIWDYFRQFDGEKVKGLVITDESASDFQWPDWPLGGIDFPSLCHMMAATQTDRAAFAHELIALISRGTPSEEDDRWMFDEISRPPESVASAILFDQTVQDYRPVLPTVKVPTLLCCGREDKLVSVAAMEHVQQSQPNVTRLVVFENSGHCPFLDEPDLFNQEVDRFIQSLGGK